MTTTRRRLLLVVLGIVAVVFPWLPFVPTSVVVNANLAGELAIIAFSLVLLTGWVGQISLGQGTFVGIGAFTTGLLARELGVPFPLNLPLAVLVTAAVAGLLGFVALRVRGLYLAVATLIFAWMADAWLFTSSWFVGSGGASSIPNRPVGRPGTLSAFDLSDKRVLWLVVLACVALCWVGLVNLRESKTGRAFFAVRGSETAAVSLGVDVTRYKLLAFAISGGMAGLAGNLLMTDLRTATPVSFAFTVSLLYLGIAVIGGVSSLGGAAAAAALFAGLNELFFRVTFLNGLLDIVTVGLLLAVLLGYPGGLGALGPALVARFRGGRTADSAVREPQNDDLDVEATGFSGAATAPSAVRRPQKRREERSPVLEATGIRVQFGGLVAVDDVTVEVREGEIVGLIGPNGAGKTTTFNAIAGLNEPTAGVVKLFGQDVTKLPVHERARLGVGRTFQLIQLFPQLTVFDNLLVATHCHNPTGVVGHIGLSRRAVAAEREARQVVREVVAAMALEDVVDRPVAGLPFGVLRQVEIARALVTRAPFLMLDEPASGLDNAETDVLSGLLRRLRDERGVSILLIEHDVRMVTALCDHLYVINRGGPLASGAAADVQRDPDVVAAYLGEAPTTDAEPADADARPAAEPAAPKPRAMSAEEREEVAV